MCYGITSSWAVIVTSMISLKEPLKTGSSPAHQHDNSISRMFLCDIPLHAYYHCCYCYRLAINSRGGTL